MTLLCVLNGSSLTSRSGGSHRLNVRCIGRVAACVLGSAYAIIASTFRTRSGTAALPVGYVSAPSNPSSFDLIEVDLVTGAVIGFGCLGRLVVGVKLFRTSSSARRHRSCRFGLAIRLAHSQGKAIDPDCAARSSGRDEDV
jgi:hypothetical protein